MPGRARAKATPVAMSGPRCLSGGAAGESKPDPRCVEFHHSDSRRELSIEFMKQLEIQLPTELEISHASARGLVLRGRCFGLRLSRSIAPSGRTAASVKGTVACS